MIKPPGPSGLLLLLAIAVISRSEVVAHFGLPNSIDHRTVITVQRDSIAVDFSVFITEVLALIELREMNTDDDSRVSDEEKEAFFNRVGDEAASGLELTLDGRRLTLERVGGVTLGMPFMKSFHYRATPGPLEGKDHSLTFRDLHYPQVTGGRTIDFLYGVGIEPVSESERDPRAMPEQLSREIENNPQQFFPFETERRTVFRFGDDDTGVAAGTVRAGPSGSPPEADRRLAGTYLEGTHGGGREGGRLERIIAGTTITPGLAVFAILLAVGLGSVHGLTPGHGKTIVAAYLVGSRGTPLAAVWLGLIVTFTHTISVFILGLLLLFARDKLPENYTGWLGFASGMLIAAMGVMLFIRRTGALKRSRSGETEGSHDYGHHHHGPPDNAGTSTWGILTLGITGGIIPCPEALAVLLLAFAVNRTLWGLLVLVAFSVGLALVLVTIGLVMVSARRLAEGWFQSERGVYAAKLLPGLSALVIAILGLAIAVQSLYHGGIFG